MSTRRVYLGHLDIGLHGFLDLDASRRPATENDIIRYLFMFGLVADEVYMQGSAPLKSLQIFAAYRHLAAAFVRNEVHELKPVFAFVLNENSEDYGDYLRERFMFLESLDNQNPEVIAYLTNRARESASTLDRELNFVSLPKRSQPVSKLFRKGVFRSLQSGEAIRHQITDETAEEAIKKLQGEEYIQTYALIDSLELADSRQIKAVFDLVREQYRKANARGSDCFNSDDIPQFQRHNLGRFLPYIGLGLFLEQPNILTAELLFKLRSLEPLRALNEKYFQRQNQRDIDQFFQMIYQFNLNSKIITLMKQSPAEAVAFVLEILKQSSGIGIKAAISGVEHLSKAFLGDVLDKHFAQECYEIHENLEHLRSEIKRIVKVLQVSYVESKGLLRLL